MKYLRHISSLLFITILGFVFSGWNPPDEGMFPLSEIGGLNLKEAGLKIEVSDIYNPGGTSLIDALVKVGGCTGSFVSDEGLILTNHHCAFGYVAAASTVENNYLENGFIAGSQEKEIPAEGLTCLITQSYEDVSERVLAAAEGKEGVERINAISDARKAIIKEAEQEVGIKAEVAEMFVGKSYVLFRYQTILDVRLVYIPPRSLGEFGGETDNWVWPRHTGDFSFLRAYVSEDGKPAKYSKDNVPYKPKKFISVNPNGVKEEDFVFMLGYPGRTFRNMPAEFLRYHEEVFLPFIQQLYASLIKKYEELGSADPALALQLASTIKGLANTEKNFRGKMLGMRRIDLTAKKFEEEKAMKEFIASDKDMAAKYEGLFESIKEAYKTHFELTGKQRTAGVFANFMGSVDLVMFMNGYMKSKTLPDEKRDKIFRAGNESELMDEVNKLFANLNREVDVQTFATLVENAGKYPDMRSWSVIEAYFEHIDSKKSAASFYEMLFDESELLKKDSFIEVMKMSPEDYDNFDDPMLKYYRAFKKESDDISNKVKEADGRLNVLLAKYTAVKAEFQQKKFIPDANSTLRLTYGYIKGYTPADATYYKPKTTISGLIDKGKTGNPDYKLYKALEEEYLKGNFGRYYDEELEDLPVAMLYNMDTTGGNSGSPVLDATGRLIGLNFDRAFEATINDYAWSQAYSRSIGVDIRFILWVVEKVGKADNLIKELGV